VLACPHQQPPPPRTAAPRSDQVLATHTREDRRNERGKPHGLKQIECLDTTGWVPPSLFVPDQREDNPPGAHICPALNALHFAERSRFVCHPLGVRLRTVFIVFKPLWIKAMKGLKRLSVTRQIANAGLDPLSAPGESPRGAVPAQPGFRSGGGPQAGSGARWCRPGTWRSSSECRSRTSSSVRPECRAAWSPQATAL